MLTYSSLDCHNLFGLGFGLIRDRLENRLYPSVSAFSADIRSVLESSPTEPQLDFDIRVKGYVPPKISSPAPPIDNHDVGSIGEKILHSLQSPLESALTGEKELWAEMQEQPAKKARLLEQLDVTLLDTTLNNNGNRSPGSPSDQLAKEASPEITKASTFNLSNGGTILGTVSAKLAKGILVGSGDKRQPSWHIKDYWPCSMEDSNEPATVEITNSPDRDMSAPAPVTESENRLTPPPPENVNGLNPVSEGVHIDANILDEDEDMEDAPGEIDEEDAPGEIDEEDAPGEIDEEDAPGEIDEEDAPGEIDEEFLPTASFAPPFIDQPEPQDFPHIHSDLHDEDAEGELDDEINLMYPDIPTVADPTPIAEPFPDVDSHDDTSNKGDLLSGYRAEDLPSPLCIIGGDSASSVGTSMNATNPMLDIPHSLQSTRDLTCRDPMVDLPELAPNRTIPDGMDLENLTNTSVLSDYPDDLDENDFDMQKLDVDRDGEGNDGNIELGENDVTPLGKKSRKATIAVKREPNGRFGRAPDRQMRRRRS